MLRIDRITWHSLRKGSRPVAEARLHKLVYFYKGKGIFINDGTDISVNGSLLVYTPPGISHHLRVTGSTSVRYYLFAFTWPGMPVRVKNILTDRYRCGNPPSSGNSLPLIEDIYKASNQDDPFLVRSAAHRLNAWIYEMCAEPRETAIETDNKHIRRALRMLSDMVAGTLDIDELAGTLGLNTSYFIRLFKKHVGTTPFRYFMHSKIEASLWDLTHTDMKIYKIAESLHFHDEFHYSRLFKSLKGISPKQYRERARTQSF